MKAIEQYNGRDRRYGGVEKKEDGGTCLRQGF